MAKIIIEDSGQHGLGSDAKTYVREIPYIKEARQTSIPKQIPESRINNWDEVELGFTDAQAIAEGRRCFSCETETCIGCGVCVEVCPVGIIYLKASENKDKVDWPQEYAIDTGLCMFCGLCVERCPTQSLYPTHEYELTTKVKADFVYDKEKLMQETTAGTWPPEREEKLARINPFQKPPGSR